MSKIKVMAGDIPQGDWTFSAGPPNSGVISLSSLSHPNVALRVISVQQISETHLKKFIPTAAWGVLGYGLLGPLGSIAGMLSGGNRSTVYFECSLLDGRSFMGATDAKTFQQLLAIAFDGSRTGMDLVQMDTDSPSLPMSNVESTGGSQQIPGRGKPFEIDEAKLASGLSPKADSSGLLPVLLWLTLIGLLIGLIYLVSNSGSTVRTGEESVGQPSDSPKSKEPESPPAAATHANESGYPTAWVFPEAAPVNPPAASHNQAETPVDCYALSKLGEARGDNFIVVADTVRNARRKGLCVDYPR